MSDNNYNSTYSTGDEVKKTYSTLERFDCESMYISMFRDHGFQVPGVVNEDRHRRQITFESIDGRIGFKLTNKEISICLEKLAEIYEWWHDKEDVETIGIQYVRAVKSRIVDFTEMRGIDLNHTRLEGFLRILRENFDVSLFKDAKPTNWIFKKDDVWLIDFDYVKPSFYLADVAQLLNYLELSNEVNYKYVNKFISMTGKEGANHVYLLFDLAAINSRLTAIHYNKKLSHHYREKFMRSVNNDLRRMEII